MLKNKSLKNRGAISNPQGRFEAFSTETFYDDWFLEDQIEEEKLVPIETFIYKEAPKSIISRNKSPDLSFNQSINPYRGCEHGCIYCYARPSHSYVNLSPGIDFETKIFYKANAAELLQKELNKKTYRCEPIVIGANTDPYQPIETKLKITRSLLDVLNAYKHPTSIITKNALILRDLDIIQEMAHKKLIKVAISLTTLSTELKTIMEPRTSAPSGRLKTIKALSDRNIEVTVMVAPIIPMINDKELEKILQAASEMGAKRAGYVLIRLPHEVKDLFREWLNTHFSDRQKHVMSIIQQMRGGKDYDSTFGKRMRGEGVFAKLIAQRFKLACQKYSLNLGPSMELDTSQFKNIGSQQLNFLNLLV